MIFMPYQEQDAQKVISWITSERMFYQWSAGVLGDYPLTEDRLNAFYREWKSKHRYMVFCLCDDEMQPVGQMIMRYPDEDPKHIRFGFILLDPAYRGKGYGKVMLNKAITYARDYLQAETVCLGVFENNDGAHGLYESLGFRDTGETEQEELMGETWNCIEMLLTLK